MMKKLLDSFLKRIANVLCEFLPELVHHPLIASLACFINQHIRFSKDILVEVHGYKMYANTLDRLIALFLWRKKVLEDSETNLLKSIVKEGMVVVDVGSNIGYHTLYMANLVGAAGKVYAFEPDQNNFRLLCKNIESNNCHNIVAVRKAVSSYTGQGKLFRSEGHSGDHRLFDSKDGRLSVDVDVVRLDDYFKDDQLIHFIKMDIQGEEYGAFLGMQDIVQKKNVVVLFEFMPSLLRKNGINPDQLLKKIEEYGFKIFFINEKTNSVDLIQAKLLEGKCRGNKYLNLLLKKNILENS